MANSSAKCRVITGKDTVFAYLCVNKPRIPLNGSKAPIYSARLIIKKSDKETMDKIQMAIANAYAEGQDILKRGYDSVTPDACDMPVFDGDLKYPNDPTYKDCWYINTNTHDKPGIVDADLNHISETRELYSGIIGRASIQFYAFNSRGKRGIACALRNIQKLADGPHLVVPALTAEEEFKEL